MNPGLGFRWRAFQHWIWPCNWLSTMISHYCSAMLWASPFRLTHPQLKWAGCFRQIRRQLKQPHQNTGAAQLQRRKTPKFKVLWCRISILGQKNLNLLVVVLSVEKKATQLQSVGKGVNCNLSLHVQAKTALKMKNHFPNRAINFAKKCLWLLIWFWFSMCSWHQPICCYGCKAAAEMQQFLLLHC